MANYTELVPLRDLARGAASDLSHMVVYIDMGRWDDVLRKHESAKELIAKADAEIAKIEEGNGWRA